MKKSFFSNKNLIVGIVGILFLWGLFSHFSKEVALAGVSYQCLRKSCDVSFKLINKTDTIQNVNVRIKAYKHEVDRLGARPGGPGHSVGGKILYFSLRF
jgi:hypothetical protein